MSCISYTYFNATYILVSGQKNKTKQNKKVCFQLHTHFAFWLPKLFFFNDDCIYKSFKCTKNILQNDLLTLTCWRNMSFVKSNILVYFWLINIKKNMNPTYIIVCVCISSCSIDKKIAHCCFYIDKIQKLKIALHIAIFGYTTGNILIFFFWPHAALFCKLFNFMQHILYPMSYLLLHNIFLV